MLNRLLDGLLRNGSRHSAVALGAQGRCASQAHAGELDGGTPAFGDGRGCCWVRFVGLVSAVGSGSEVEAEVGDEDEEFEDADEDEDGRVGFGVRAHGVYKFLEAGLLGRTVGNGVAVVEETLTANAGAVELILVVLVYLEVLLLFLEVKLGNLWVLFETFLKFLFFLFIGGRLPK